MNEPTMETLAQRLDRVEREEGGRTAMRIVLIVAVLLLAGCGDDTGRYQPFGEHLHKEFPLVLDTRTGCVLKLWDVGSIDVFMAEGSGEKVSPVNWRLFPLNKKECGPE